MRNTSSRPLRRVLAALSACLLFAALGPAALANGIPADAEDEVTGDTLAGAFTTPDEIADMPLTEALLPGSGADAETPDENGAQTFALPSFYDTVTLNLYLYNAATGNYDYTTGVTLSWREALAGIVNAEEGGFYSASTGYNQNAALAAWTAQAVAAHSYLLYNGCSTNKATSEYWRPVDAGTTAGQLLYRAVDAALTKVAVTGSGHDPAAYNMALTSYYASAGYNPETGARGTANCSDVWVQSIPYLVGVESPYDESYSAKFGKSWEHSKYNYTRWDELISGVNSLYGVDLSSKRGQADALAVTGRSTYGYVTTLRAGDVNGLDGQKLYTGFYGTNWTVRLASGSYRIDYIAGHTEYESNYGTVEEPWHLVAYGSGHGVGLSQLGSLGYACERGWSAWQILAHYYPGIAIYDTAEGALYTPSEASAALTPLLEPLTHAMGDVNRDGAVDLWDLVTLGGMVKGTVSADSMQKRLADLDGNGAVTAADSAALSAQLAG